MACWLRVLSLTTFPFAFAGCYVNGSITNLEGSGPINKTVSNAASLENVSGSNTYETTSLTGFRVRHSSGLIVGTQLAVTPKSYRVYSNVNGRITSQELNK